MITNFEEITTELNEQEMSIVPAMIAGFKTHLKDNPIKAPEIIKRWNTIKGGKVKLTEPRLRKIVNYIRTNSLLPLIATSNGYYVSWEREEIEKQIRSLDERAASIQQCSNGLLHLLKTCF